MTPKEKGFLLVYDFYSILKNIKKSKQCAIIAVEEILSVNLFNTDENEYWLQVKTEIENL